MKWYLVKLIFSIEVGGSHKAPAQFDEQLRLISAVDGAAAYGKAHGMGAELSTSFRNSDGLLVSWRFINVSEIILINKIYDGVEIYSGTIETEEKQRFINSVQQRSAEFAALQTA